MYETGTASGYKDLLNRLNTFLTGNGTAWGVKYTGAADGRLAGLRGGPNSVAETYTLTGGWPGPFNIPVPFTVVGSVSGNIGTISAGETLTTDRVSFTLEAGTVAYGSTDTFTFSTAPAWVAKRAVAGDEYIWQAPGADGSSAVYVGAKAFANEGGDIFNIQLQGYTGFDAGASFPGQPGAITATQGQGIALWQGAIPYWFVANGRRVIVIAKVSSVYQAAYLGLIEQYVDPLVYPYALAVGGTILGNQRYSTTSDANRCFPMAFSPNNADGQLKLRLPTGAWRPLSAINAAGSLYTGADGAIWPYQAGVAALRPGLDGSAPLLPVNLFDGNPKQVYGRLDGISATTGFGTGAESIIASGVHRYLVVPNVNRTAPDQFFTVKLD